MSALRPVLLLAAVALAGCAGSSEPFPSLSPRPIEKLDVASAPQTEAPPPAATDPAADSAARTALAAAEAGDRAFTELLDTVAPVIRAGAAREAGSEPWLDAQQALSRLQAARLATSDALQTLDDQRMARGYAAPDPALESAYARAAALEAAQAEKYAAMNALFAAR
ncbi:hypothetical protein [Sphingomonas quercus]|uniref:Uncharacterized protein n=1 Tax=Sphingomonas quercus TaxID=2842451 RepID=A0ABS6BDE5_9SPHN|nr:hypothetical protein [Sphingomonas quercus]MBU3076338.1 hypothetical protein [Sphingomonas quercus]